MTATLRDYITDILLRHEEVVVNFTKKDGTNRVMRCTLHPSKLPAVVVDESKTPRKVNENVLAVYDLELSEWRSFIVKSATSLAYNVKIDDSTINLQMNLTINT